MCRRVVLTVRRMCPPRAARSCAPFGPDDRRCRKGRATGKSRADLRQIKAPAGQHLMLPQSPLGRDAMTAMRGYVPAATGIGALGVHSLDQFVIAVPDCKPA